MRIQTISQSPKVSSAKLGVYCSLFCLGAGLVYGWLESMNYPVNSFGKGWMAFSTTLFWSGVVVAFLMHRKGFRGAPLIFLAVYGINIIVSLFSVNMYDFKQARSHLIMQLQEQDSHRTMGDYFFPPPDYSPNSNSK